MRKIITILALGMIAAMCHGQVSNPSIVSVTTAPSGSCANGLPNRQVLSTGAQYSCQSGTWGEIGSGGGTVTHTTGALTANSVIVGNGGADVKPSLAAIDATGAMTGLTSQLINGGAAASTDGLIFQLVSSNPDQTGFVLQNTTSGVAYGAIVLGNNSSIPGYLFADLTTGAINFLFYSTDAAHPINAMQSKAVLGFVSSSDPTTSPLDTGVSRLAPGVLAVGNGTQGDTSGGIKAAAITMAASTAPTCTSATRGQFQYTAGGTGVKDIVQVCAKDASDAYAYRTIY